jgi:hypothetical protein
VPRMDGRRKRHCWECRRRYLVCDSTEPECRRCSASGVTCPGYSDVKPTRIRWLAPGTVNSRTRKRDPSLSDENEKKLLKQQVALATELRNCIAVPPFQMKTDVCALAQAAEYCRSRPRVANSWINNIV